jgi:hypothetical protein
MCSEIPCIVTEKGSITTQAGIEDEIHKFYSSLWTRDEYNPIILDDLLRYGEPCDQQASNKAAAEFTEFEVAEVISRMPKNKSPGPDGLCATFYDFFKEHISLLLTNVLQEAARGERLPKNFAEANIRLIPKSGDIKELKNWRPITISNIDYKVIASCIKDRLVPIAKKTIEIEQIGFMPQRQITDHIYSLQAIYNLDTKLGLKGAFLLLDQEKAYDRVEHEVMIKVLKARGAPDNIINLIQKSYEDAPLRVIVNHGFTKPLVRTRGVFQGCPCAPIIYNFIADILAKAVKTTTRGMHLNPTTHIQIAQYADDTMIFLEDQEDAQRAIEAVSRFNKATGSRTNFAKSKGVVFSKDNIDAFPPMVPWQSSNEPIKYLGIHFCTDPHKIKVNWDNLSLSVVRTINVWKKHGLSAAGKKVVWNTFILPKALYSVTGAEVPEGWIQSIDLKMKEWLTTKNIKNRWQCFTQRPENGGIGVRTLNDASQIAWNKWANDLFACPDGPWQKIFWAVLKTPFLSRKRPITWNEKN